MPTVASYCATFLKPEMLHIYRQVSGLQRYETFVVCKERQCERKFPFRELEVQPVVKSNFLRRFWLKYVKGEPPIVYRGEYGALAGVLERRQPDLMHVYFGHTGVHLLPFILRWATPTIVSFHGMDIQPRADKPGYLDQLRSMLQVIPLVLARSESLKQRLIDLGCPEEKIRINRTGIPMQAYPVVTRQHPGKQGWQFVQACRLIEKKGIDVSLRAFAKFLRNHPGSTFTLAGEGPLLEPLQALVAELGIAEQVHFPGFLSEKQMFALFAKSHVFVHPSQLTEDQNQEGVPNSILEAMATGLPILSTYHGGIPEAVDHGRSGLLVPERDEAGLLANMCRLADEPDFWAELGLHASQDVREKFEQSRAITALEAIYDEAIRLGRGELR
jgi:colanic acid/amylovoran biosynthesis glycosyltransferase